MRNFFNFSKTKRNTDKTKSILSGKINNEKIYASNCATLTIKSEDKIIDDKHIEKIKTLASSFIDEPAKFFDYIRQSKTPVCVLKNADKYLAYIDEKIGFILPQKGKKALFLNLIFLHKFSFKTKEMFIVKSYNMDLCALIYQFYRWYCYRAKVSGYSIETQEKFKHVFEICETSKINSISFEEIIELKSAIKRDIEAINFAQSMVKNTLNAKEKMKKIMQGNAIKA